MLDRNSVAIIGMGCLFPNSNGLKKYWRLLFHGQDAITEVPESHWSSSEYFDSDPKRPDHVYCTRGGFLTPIEFDPTEFGIPPNSLEATDTSQLLGLLVAKMALEDCGYGDDQDFDRDRTSVILGVTGTQELVIPLSSRLGHPKWRKALVESAIPPEKTEEIIQKISDSYVPWHEYSFPGLLGNVVAGRICNRLDLRGTNCVVDAACASSLSAVHLSLLELQSGRSNMVVTGGVDTLNDIFMHMCFSKTHTLSATGDARPFSKDADGTVLGEGIGMLVLKRLSEAETDGDRIYAVVKGLGSSSDGKSQSIYSPRSEGQARALRAAYNNAGISPASVQLIEAHGTGTRVGDRVEFEALNQVFKEFDVNGKKSALGSVKSMIGHTKASAGAAGLIKAALSLYHKVLPPTLKAETPDPNLDIENSPFYLNTTTRPWFSNNGDPRRAGISAFGFGGSNFHVVLEEYRRDKTEISWDGSTEIVALSAHQPDSLVESLRQFQQTAADGLSESEFSLKAAESRRNFSADQPYRLLMVSENIAENEDLFQRASKALDSGLNSNDLTLKNIYLGGPEDPGKLAFVFPGQGSQYLAMGRDIACTFPQAMQILEDADKLFKGPVRLSDLIFPPVANNPQARTNHEAILKRTDNAQPAIGAISLAMLKVLQDFGINPAATCGHSFGELTALCAAGWISETALLKLSIIRGQLMAAAGGNHNPPQGAMLAVQAPMVEIEALIAASDQNIILANRNSPAQGVLSGPTTAILEIEKIFNTRKIRTIRLPVSAAFHSDQLNSAVQPFLNALEQVSISPTAVEVFSNTTARAYPAEPDQARDLLAEQLICPVDFVNEIDNLYRSGIRTFVEIGPKSILTGLISATLQDRQFEATALDASAGKAYGVADLARLLCRLASLGYPVTFAKWETPLLSNRKSRMSVLLNGTNYKNQKLVDRGQPAASSAESRAEDKGQKAEAIRRQNTEGRRLKDGGGVRTTVGNLQSSTSMNDSNDRNHLNHQNELSDQQNDTMKKENSTQSEFIRDAYRVVAEGLKSMQSLQSQTAEAHQKFLETQTEANRALQEMMKNTQRLAERTLGIQAESNSTASTIEKGIQIPPVLPVIENDPAFGMNENTISSENLSVPRENTTAPPAPALPNATVNEYAKDEETRDFPIESIRQSPGVLPDIETTMLEIVSQLTGYPTEMLGLDMDIEAELGIDSIKRVEILSNLEETLPDLPTVSPEIMGSLKTLGQIIEFLGQPDHGQPDERQSIDTVPAVFTAPAATRPESAGNRSLIIEATMLEVVSQLTGYPVEMLGLDMDIEAELGIDSIKRVEILSTLEEKMPDLPAVSPDMMGTLKTLGQIVEYLANPVTTEASTEPSSEMQPRVLSVVASKVPKTSLYSDLTANDPDLISIPRNVVTAVEAPPVSETTVPISATKKIFVTEDHTGLSEEIAEALAKLDIKAVRISLDILKYKSRLPDAAGLIIVQNPRSDQMDQDLKNAFILAKFLAPDLIASASRIGAIFATVTRLDGAFGLRCNQLQNPAQGGLAGLAKTAAIEWENICCHAIDVAPNWSDDRAIASAIVKEVMSVGPIEIGLNSDYRCTLSLEPDPHPVGSINLNQDDVVVISGGVRGITAAAALELARHTDTKLVLLGRSPEPFAEPEWLLSLENEADIKKALLENEYRDKTATPAEVEKAYKNYIANREIADNLKELKSTGASVYYYSVDVRDLDTVQAVLDGIHTNHGPVSGIIHGAGVLEDRLIIDKTSDQFERVYDTKVRGLNNLLKATHRDSLKYLVLFSSVAARLGNRGQVDYAMANEVLNKIAQTESAKRADCRVISINWGPWDGGMVTPALKREFVRNGIPLIPTDCGAKSMLYEMMAENNSPVEIVIGAKLNDADPKSLNLPKRPELVKSTPTLNIKQLALSFEREIDVHRYPILQSHIIDGKPVVPLALMTEWFAHGALHENPGLVLHGLDDIRVMKGIRLEQDNKLIRLLAGKLQKNGEFFEVEVELRDGKMGGQDVLHAKAKAILSDTLASAPAYQFSKTRVAKAYTRKMNEVYDKILFHGMQLHGIRKIVSCSSRRMVAHISTAPAPGEWMSAPLRNEWIADPLVLDCAFQMATVWCFEEKGVVSLPSYGASYRQYRDQFPSDGVTVVLEVAEVTNRRMRGNFTFLDTNDAIVASLFGYEAIMNASLFKAFKPQYRASA